MRVLLAIREMLPGRVLVFEIGRAILLYACFACYMSVLLAIREIGPSDVRLARSAYNRHAQLTIDTLCGFAAFSHLQ